MRLVRLWTDCKIMTSMNSSCYSVAMDLGVCQLRNFSISFLSSLLSAESSHLKLDNRYKKKRERERNGVWELKMHVPFVAFHLQPVMSPL